MEWTEKKIKYIIHIGENNVVFIDVAFVWSAIFYRRFYVIEIRLFSQWVPHECFNNIFSPKLFCLDLFFFFFLFWKANSVCYWNETVRFLSIHFYLQTVRWVREKKNQSFKIWDRKCWSERRWHVPINCFRTPTLQQNLQ